MKTFEGWQEEYKNRVSSIGGGRQTLGVFEPVIDQAIREAAQHLLAVAEEWCKENEPTWPSEESCPRDLLNYLNQYIHATAQEGEDGE